jgi:hypothetical protein
VFQSWLWQLVGCVVIGWELVAASAFSHRVCDCECVRVCARLPGLLCFALAERPPLSSRLVSVLLIACWCIFFRSPAACQCRAPHFTSPRRTQQRTRLAPARLSSPTINWPSSTSLSALVLLRRRCSARLFTGYGRCRRRRRSRLSERASERESKNKTKPNAAAGAAEQY